MLRQHFVDEGLVTDAPAARLLAERLKHPRVNRIAMSSPRFGAERWTPPTRRIALSCSGDDSGMSEESIVRRVYTARCAAARPPGADNPDRFAIATSPERIGHHEQAPVRGSAQP